MEKYELLLSNLHLIMNITTDRERKQIKDMTIEEIQKYDKKTDEMNDLTKEELSHIEYPFSTITLKSFNENEITFDADTANGFTVKELIECIKDVENIARPESNWLGGIDIDHIYFEGLGKISNGVYEIWWGS